MAKRKTVDFKSTKTRDDDGSRKRPKRRGDDEDADTNATLKEVKWWLAPDDSGDEAARRLWTWVDRLRAMWAVDGISDLIHEAIYADEPIARGGMFDGRQWQGRSDGGSCILNAIKSLVDTASARLTKVRSMPCISADDADYDEKQFATEVSRVLRRKMGSEDIEEMSPLVIRDFCIRGTGVHKVVAHDGDTATKRVPMYEIVFDHREAQFIQAPHVPSVLAHVRPEQREHLLARYPKYKAAIEDAALFTRMDPWMQFVYQGPSLADLVEVAESWHPPSSPGGADGQHIVCIRGTTVLREPWMCPRYPLVFSYWTAPIRGVRGKGLVAEHAHAQDMINGILHDAREGIRQGSQLKVFASRGANVNKNHLRPGSPHVVEVDGAPGQIQFVAADPVSKQAWAIAFQIKSEMYNISGISEWSATANKPLGEGASGKALDTMNDNQSDRFAQVETGWQQARVAVGRAHIDMARHMKTEHDDRFPEQPDAPEELATWIDDHAWDKVDVDGGNYHLTLEPINFITGTRGGKLEEIAEAGKAGLIPDPTMIASLVDEPDIQAMNRPILGPLNRIKMCLSELTKKNCNYIDVAPDASMNLALAKLMAKGEIEQAKADRAGDVIVGRFQQFLDDIESLETKAAQGSPSLAGAQANTIIAQPNAQTLQGGPPPMGPPGMPPPGPGSGPMPPEGMS